MEKYTLRKCRLNKCEKFRFLLNFINMTIRNNTEEMVLYCIKIKIKKENKL